MNANMPSVRCARLGLAVILTALAMGAAARACDTPVYRYAMYRWESAPYEVYHFHRGQPDVHFAEVEKVLMAAAANEVTPANVVARQVNLEDEAELKSIPPDVAKLFQAKSDPQLPLTLVVNPLGYEVYSGALTPPTAEIGVVGANSPFRRQIGELLKQGNAAVFILVPGKDGELNAAVEKAVEKLVADVNSGKVQLYDGPPTDGPPEPARNAEPAEDAPPADDKQPSHSIARLKLERDVLTAQDPWLLRSLMAAEPDLGPLQAEPMVFVVYGRARVLPPYVGKGITVDNLIEVTEFITGACSCTVKEQNPGVDLLMAYDWKAASAALVEKFGSEEGNQESLTDLFPQLITPAKPDSPKAIPDPPRSAPAEDESGEESSDNGKSTSDIEGGTATRVALAKVDETPRAGSAAPPSASAETPAAGSASVSAAAAERAVEAPARSTTAAPAGPNLMTTLGIGLAVAIVALLTATFFIMKQP
jgi:hypothetical protein